MSNSITSPIPIKELNEKQQETRETILSFPRIKDILEMDNQEVLTIVIVKNKEIRLDKNNKEFVTLTLSDKTGTIDAKIWKAQDADKAIQDGSCLYIKGNLGEFNNNKQITITQHYTYKEEDFYQYGLDLNMLIVSAPKTYEYYLSKIENIISQMEDEDIKKITQHLINKNLEKLKYYPAAKTNHHAYKTGLLEHTSTMLDIALSMYEIYNENYPGLNKDIISSGIILHDLCKIGEILSDTNGNSPGYSLEGDLIGHLVEGAMQIRLTGMELNIPKDISTHLEHIVISHHGKLEYGSAVIPKTPEALIVSMIDILDAKINPLLLATKNLNHKESTPPVFPLDNRRITKL